MSEADGKLRGELSRIAVAIDKEIMAAAGKRFAFALVVWGDRSILHVSTDAQHDLRVVIDGLRDFVEAADRELVAQQQQHH